MKHFLITQARNESHRLKNWLTYHASQGIDGVVFFDDYSTDDTAVNIKNICADLNITLHYHLTDGYGEMFETGNSESYGFSSSCNHRIIRSLSYGITLCKNLYQDQCMLYCLDVDEYVVSSTQESVSSITQNMMLQNNIQRIYCHSFDVDDRYAMSEFITKQPESCYRWDFKSRQQSIFKNRGKSICLSSFISSPLPLAGNVVHDLGIMVTDMESFLDFATLRLHHFRKPPLIDPNYTIGFCYDDTLLNKSRDI